MTSLVDRAAQWINRTKPAGVAKPTTLKGDVRQTQNEMQADPGRTAIAVKAQFAGAITKAANTEHADQ